MTPTLEVRWFMRGSIPPAAELWFDALGPPVDEASRTDRYLIPTEGDDVGLKVREGRVEAKQRTGVRESAMWGMAKAAPESWRKWTLGLATDASLHPGWIDVPKTRRQRWVPLQTAACALELAQVQLHGEVWWTVCFEASGGDAQARQLVFEAAASRWLDRPDAPSLRGGDACGYPAWLRREARR